MVFRSAGNGIDIVSTCAFCNVVFLLIDVHQKIGHGIRIFHMGKLHDIQCAHTAAVQLQRPVGVDCCGFGIFRFVCSDGRWIVQCCRIGRQITENHAEHNQCKTGGNGQQGQPFVAPLPGPVVAAGNQCFVSSIHGRKQVVRIHHISSSFSRCALSLRLLRYKLLLTVFGRRSYRREI